MAIRPYPGFSAVGALNAFLGVVLVGTLWKLAAMHLMASNNEFLVNTGQGMAFQY